VNHALAIASGSGSEIVFAHIIEPGGEPETEKVADELATLCASAARIGVASTSHVSRGYPDQELAKLGAELGVRLTVVGTHGRSGVKRFFLGSVAERTARLSEGDVLVSRGEASSLGYHRVLVPTDFSTAADRAFGVALGMAAPGAHVELLHCWRPPAGITEIPEKALAAEYETVMTEATRSAATLIETHPTDKVKVGFDTRRGPAASAIQDKLSEIDWDLVVMGSHGRRGVRRFLLGSVAELTVRHAPCSVLVVHGGDDS
jgi:nucleotide-binding universal stress UspA family protein